MLASNISDVFSDDDVGDDNEEDEVNDRGDDAMFCGVSVLMLASVDVDDEDNDVTTDMMMMKTTTMCKSIVTKVGGRKITEI